MAAERPSLPGDVAATIEALLPPGTPAREELLRQLPHTVVSRRCGCGCATVDLLVDRSAVPGAALREEDAPVAASATFHVPGTPEGAGVLLFAADGYLSCLEVYSVSDVPVRTWPDPRTLTLDSDHVPHGE
ncbi:hypothetical protein [Streptomyces ramulosus]|uniref:Uncharacterized protein n=1 Tax=Streptomyces ramulosus TaxID=47762 RepID=A0ABW1FH64_9ACTN